MVLLTKATSSSATKLDVEYTSLTESFLDFQKLVREMIGSGEVLSNESSCTMWSPIVNSAYIEEDQVNRTSNVEWKYSTSQLLMEHMKTDEYKVFSAKKRVTMEVWNGFVRAIILLEDIEAVCTQRTGGIFLLIQAMFCDIPDTMTNLTELGSPWYFIIMTASEKTTLFVCGSSHKFFCIQREEVHGG